MRTCRPPSSVKNALLGTVLALVGSMAFAAPPAQSANADACGVVTQRAMAQAFGLDNSEQQRAVLRKPGNSAGVVHARCRVLAWSGRKPVNAAQRRTSLLAGRAVQIRIETWVPDTGPASEIWLGNFPAKLDGLKARAKDQFINGSLEGEPFRPPRFGAEAGFGYQAPSGRTRKLRAFWWDRRDGMIVSFNVVEARAKPIVRHTRRLAARVVPAIG